MMTYVLHAAALVALSYAFYILLLGKETFFKLNRWVLLMCMVSAFAIPLIEVPQAWSLRDELAFFEQSAPALPAQTVAGEAEHALPIIAENPEADAEISSELPAIEAAPAAAPTWPVERIVSYIYWCGVLIFGINLLLQFVVLLYQMYTLPAIQDGAIRIVEWSHDKAPCSFGNSIFINPEKYDWETYNQIIQHEKIHIAQGHSFDILLAELLVVVQWFNPFAWQYRRSVEQNIEYLTDAEMLRSRSVDATDYQMNLLRVAVPNLPLGLTTNYNHSTLKKRILMMQSKKSSVRSSWKYLFLLPVLAFSALAFNSAKKETRLSFHEQNDYNSLLDEQGFGFTSSGLWQGTIDGDEVCIVFSQNRSKENKHGTWTSSSCFKKSEFDALPTGQESEFHLKRAAGQMTFIGKFEGNEGYGRFNFTSDAAFKSYLEEIGLESPDEETMVHLFFADMNREQVSYLKGKGFKDFSLEQLTSVAIHDLKKQDVEAYWQELEKAGYEEKMLEMMVTMKIHDLTPAYIQSIRAAGFKDASTDDLLAAKIHDVTPEYVQSLKNAGYKNLSIDDVVSFKIHEVDGDFIKSMTQTNGKIPSSDELLSAKIHHVNVADLAKFEAMGLGDISLEDLSNFAIHGIDAAYVEGWKKAGYELDTDELLTAKIHDLSADYIKEFNQNSNFNLDIDEALSLKIHDVTPEFIKGFKALGYEEIDADEALNLKIHEVNAQFIKGFEPLGFKQIDLDELVNLKIHEVTPDFIRSMREKGFKDLSLDEYISLKIMGSANRSRSRED